MPNLNDIEKLGRNKADLIDDILAKFGGTVTDLQSWLFTAFYDDFVERVVSEGSIKSGIGAVNAVNRSPVWKKYYKQSNNVGGFMVDSFGRLTSSLGYYFNALIGRETLSDVDRVAKQVIEQYGFDGKVFLEGTYFNNLLKDATVERRIKSLAIQAIRSGKSLKDFQKELRTIINGDKATGKAGIVEAHYYTNATTAFSEFDRTVALQLADKYGLNNAIWSGPQLRDTRDFCQSKKGKVFTKAEIKEMDSRNWQGKIPGQSTLISCGGYNCVDTLLWITDDLAAQMKEKEKQI